MTPDLKTLMDRATDRPTSFTPDPATLVAAGRRQVRNRRLAGSIAALATVVALAGGAAVAVQEHRSVAPAARPTDSALVPSQPVKLCTTSNGTVIGDGAWRWPEVVAISDRYGSASIRKGPEGTYGYAFCITQSTFGPAAPYGARGGVLLRKTAIDARSSVTTVFGRAYGSGMKVLVQTGDGKTGEAVVKSEFYIYRHVEARPWPGDTPSALTRTIDAKGNVSAVGRW